MYRDTLDAHYGKPLGVFVRDALQVWTEYRDSMLTWDGAHVRYLSRSMRCERSRRAWSGHGPRSRAAWTRPSFSCLLCWACSRRLKTHRTRHSSMLAQHVQCAEQRPPGPGASLQAAATVIHRCVRKLFRALAASTSVRRGRRPAYEPGRRRFHLVFSVAESRPVYDGRRRHV